MVIVWVPNKDLGMNIVFQYMAMFVALLSSEKIAMFVLLLSSERISNATSQKIKKILNQKSFESIFSC